MLPVTIQGAFRNVSCVSTANRQHLAVRGASSPLLGAAVGDAGLAAAPGDECLHVARGAHFGEFGFE